MIRREITYVDFDGEEKTDVVYFHLTKAEILEFNLSYKGGLSAFLEDMVKERDMSKLVEYFKKLILFSYAEKTATGRLIKNDEIRDAFKCTEAYSQLFMELATNTQAGIDFVNGIVPTELQKEIAELSPNENLIPIG